MWGFLANISTSRRAQPESGGQTNPARPRQENLLDEPISSPDEKVDRFGYRDHAVGLVTKILDIPVTGSLTIGIYGDWGSGKTSLMKLIEERIRTHNKTIKKVWVNVWELNNQEEIWAAFLQALVGEVHRKRWWSWERLTHINLLKLAAQLLVNAYRIALVITPVILGGVIGKPDASLDDFLQFLLIQFSDVPDPDRPVTALGVMATYGLALWVIVKPAIEKAREVVKFDLQAVLKYAPYEAKITELQRLKGQFARMVEVWVGKNGRLVVFIDDLDRCTPDKIGSVLEALKVFIAVPRCVYIIGLDDRLVRLGVRDRYSFTDNDARDYLDKIIQLRFDLPPLQPSHLRAYIQHYLPPKSGVQLAEDKQVVDLAAVFVQGVEPNPRKVKRALLAYDTIRDQFKPKPNEAPKFNEELLAKMMLLRDRIPSLHDLLVEYPGLLLGIEELVNDDKFNEASLRSSLGLGTVLLHDNPIDLKVETIEAVNRILRVGGQYGKSLFQNDAHNLRTYVFLDEDTSDRLLLEKELKHRMGSQVHTAAISAAFELRGYGLLFDGLGEISLIGARLEGAVLTKIGGGADLRGLHMDDVHLDEADLTGAQLEGAKLSHSHLQRATLIKADLTKAILRGANLQDARLYSAVLREADLRRADLQRAKLQQVDLMGAHLEGANLDHAEVDEQALTQAFLDDQTILPDGRPNKNGISKQVR